jgi:hypothetical protein
MKWLLILGICGVIFVLYVRHVEKTAVFFPSAEIALTPRTIGLPFEDVYFTTKDGVTLNGWLVHAPGARATMIFCHGNAGNIGDRVEKIRYFVEMGVNVFIFDYRGYGKSQGKPSESGLYLDAVAAYDYLAQRQDIDPAHLFAYGASLGGAVAVDLATRRDLACLIIDSSFSSARDVARFILPVAPGFLIRTRLDSLNKVPRVRIPKLFLHSREDEIIPFALGQKLFEAAAEPKVFHETKGDHNQGYSLYPKTFTQAIASFLRDVKVLEEK